MGILSNISGREAVKIFQKFGDVVDHQTGSHIILYHESRPTLSVPDHKELGPWSIKRFNKKKRFNIRRFLESKMIKSA